MNLQQKLVEIRKGLTYAQKDTKGYNYKYVSGASILAKVRVKMDELGVLLIPSVTSWETESDGKKKVVKCNMSMLWMDAENPTERMEIPFACFGEQDDISKAFGSALTYSERYFLMKFFNVPTDEDDPDKFQSKNATEVRNALNQSEIALLREIIKKAKVTEASVCASFKVDKLENMSKKNHASAINALNARITKNGNS